MKNCDVVHCNGEKMKRVSFLLMSILFIDAIPMVSTAYAYTDPGSGILIWQMLVSALVGGLYYFRKAIANLRVKLKIRKNAK